jgi:lipopolysaccharide export system permease protein
MRLSLGGSLGQGIAHVKPEWLTYERLREEQALLDSKKAEPGKEKQLARDRMQVAMVVSEKANLSLAVFAFAFVAVPLGIKVSRRETSANLGVSVLLVLGYYILLNMVKALDRHPEYRPDLLLWIPNILLVWFGVWLLRRVER